MKLIQLVQQREMDRNLKPYIVRFSKFDFDFDPFMRTSKNLCLILISLDFFITHIYVKIFCIIL